MTDKQREELVLPDVSLKEMSERIKDAYNNHCLYYHLHCNVYNTVRPYNDSTLFCIAGMQAFSDLFKNPLGITAKSASIQPCLRINDAEEIKDGSHLLYFNMLGLFSWHTLSVKSAIDFWMDFLSTINLPVDYVTVHPERAEWAEYYLPYKIEVRSDEGCTWSDGDVSGYCTEFYSDGIEIGNIVNPGGNCIDCGFGLERIAMIKTGRKSTEVDTLQEAIWMIINSDYVPANKQQGYVLRKLLRRLYRLGGSIQHIFFDNEVKRQQRLDNIWQNMKDKHQDKSPEWWLDTHGIDVKDYENQTQ